MSAISLEITGDIARITIDNPEKRNALAIEDLIAMGAALDEAAGHEGLRALVLTGAGNRVFSGGVDLSDVSGDGQWEDNPLTALADRLERFPRPTIARIGGRIRGGAVELALACDFRIGAHGIDLAVPASRLGIHYETGGLARAHARLGGQVARRLFLLAEVLDDEAMLASGYLDRLVTAEELDQAVDDMLKAIRAGAPLAVDGMKATLNEIGHGGAPEAKARIQACWASDDLKEGLAAVKEKRPPVFRGR